MFDLKDLVWSDVELDSDKASLGGDTYETMDGPYPGPLINSSCYGGAGNGVVQRIGCIDVRFN